MMTPSGRFKPGEKICLSISDFHPESWNPLWGVSMILLGLQSFFYETASTTGALNNVSSAEKRRLASQSLEFNARNMTYRKLFPDLVQLAKEKELERTRKAEAASAAGGSQGKTSKENEATVAVATDGGGAAKQQQGEAGEDRAREGPRPYLGSRELFIGAAALIVAVGVAFIALERL
jgi:ubiquitin-conjugating enzyme E2 J2